MGDVDYRILDSLSAKLESMVKKRNTEEPPSGGNGGEPPMELIERVETLEKDVKAIGIDVAVIKSNYSTKSDLFELRSDMHKEFSAFTWRIIGACGALVAATYFIARYIH